MMVTCKGCISLFIDCAELLQRNEILSCQLSALMGPGITKGMLTAAKRTQAGAILIDNTAAHIVAENLIAALFYAMQNEACEVSGTLDHLAQVKAEAGRAGYLQGHLDAGGVYNDWHKKHSEYHADKYAEQIRAKLDAKAGA